MSHENHLDAEKEKQQAASSSVFAAILLTGLKLVVGFLTGSLGILSEAAHSGLDLVAALVTYFAVRVSDQPADEEHQYGHGKIENLSALIETLLLLITCVWIFYEVIQRLFFKSVHVETTVWAFVVMVISVIVDINRSKMLYRVAEKHGSQALEADALHFSTDIWSSLTVIAGLTFVWLSGILGPEWGWLVKADAVAALIVAFVIVYVSIQMGKKAIAVLLDTAPSGLVEKISSKVSKLSRIQSVGPLRVRQSGAFTFIDITVGVDRSVSLEEAHKIAESVEHCVIDLVPKSDVVVHIDPVQEAGESLHQSVFAIAGKHGLQTHNIQIHDVLGEYFISLDVEVASDLTLAEAHHLVTKFEEALHSELPHIKEINTHIEPVSSSTVPISIQDERIQNKVRIEIIKLVNQKQKLRGCHNFRIWPDNGGYDVVLHCLSDPDLPVVEAHNLAEELEKEIHSQVSGIHQILIHVEPEETPQKE